MRLRLLDLFCGAGGASEGYARAGFEVVGVDVERQPRYPFEFRQADALGLCASYLAEFDVVHASPPCQAYVQLADRARHPRLIEPVRARLVEAGIPYVIENVPTAPMKDYVTLCGTMFGLGVQRHRRFEFGGGLTVPVAALSPCAHGAWGRPRGYYGGHSGGPIQRKGRIPIERGTSGKAEADMGIGWMVWDELREAIPPAYTEWVGRRVLEAMSPGGGSLASEGCGPLSAIKSAVAARRA